MTRADLERGVLLYTLFVSYVPGSAMATNYANHWGAFCTRHGAELLEHAARGLGEPVPSGLKELQSPAAAQPGDYVTRSTMLHAVRALHDAPDDTARGAALADIVNQIERMFVKWPPTAGRKAA